MELGERYSRLQQWLEEYRAGSIEEFDLFLNRLYLEILSQPGFGFFENAYAQEMTENLVQSVQNFKEGASPILAAASIPLGREFQNRIREGALPAQYLRGWMAQSENGVLLSAAYTFLLSNRPVDYQIWLNCGSYEWLERIQQSLTNPFVLRQDWPEGVPWTDLEESQMRRARLARLVLGLVRRCRGAILLACSELSEAGYDERGPLIRAAGLERPHG
jgi:hypothetical protein